MTFNECYQKCIPSHWSYKSIILWALWLVLVILMSIWAYQKYHPVEVIRVDHILFDKTEYARGENVVFTFIGEKFRDIPADILVELVNGERIMAKRYSSNNPVGKIFKPRDHTT